jgi:hypothetical protein
MPSQGSVEKSRKLHSGVRICETQWGKTNLEDPDM